MYPVRKVWGIVVWPSQVILDLALNGGEVKAVAADQELCGFTGEVDVLGHQSQQVGIGVSGLNPFYPPVSVGVGSTVRSPCDSNA